MSTIVLHCQAGDLVSANERIHWTRRAKVQKWWRGMAGWAAEQVTVPHYYSAGKFRITATIRYPDRRRRDVSNLYPYVVKPCIDGIVDAEWIRDDSDDVVASVTIERDPERGPHRVTITVVPA